MKPRKYIKRIFSKDEISSRIIPLLSTCSSSSILDTASNKSLTTTPSLTTTTAYQSRSLYGTRTYDMHLIALQFPHPKWTNKNRNRKDNSRFITLSLVVMAIVQSSGRAAPIGKQWRVQNYFVVKRFSWVSINHEIFLTRTLLKTKYFWTKIFQTTEFNVVVPYALNK